MLGHHQRRKLSFFEHIEPKFLKIVPEAFYPGHQILESARGELG